MKSTPIPVPHFLSVPEVGKICGVSRNTVYNWVKKGVLDAYQTPGRTNLIRPGDLVIFMQKSGMFIPEKLNQLAEKDAMEVGFIPKGSDPTRAKAKILLVNCNDKAVAVVTRSVGEFLEIFTASTGFEALHLLTVNPDMSLMLLADELIGLSSDETIRQSKALNEKLKVLRISSKEDEPADLNTPLRVPMTRQIIQNALKEDEDS